MYFVYFVYFVCPVLTNVALVTASGVVLRHWESKEKISFKEWSDDLTTCWPEWKVNKNLNDQKSDMLLFKQ